MRYQTDVKLSQQERNDMINQICEIEGDRKQVLLVANQLNDFQLVQMFKQIIKSNSTR